MATLTLPAPAALAAAAPSPGFRVVYALAMTLPCLAVAMLSLPLAVSLVQATGTTVSLLLVCLLLGPSFIIVPVLANVLINGRMASLALVAALVLGATWTGFRLGKDPAWQRLSGWAYIVAVNDLAKARSNIAWGQGNPDHPLAASLAPDPTTLAPAQAIAAARFLEDNPPLLGEKAQRFAMAAGITGVLPAAQVRQLGRAAAVPASVVVQARDHARAHPPTPQASLLTQQAWLRLAGEQSWEAPLSVDQDDGR